MWSTVSGPGTVTFGDANALSTSASFSIDGTYVLRLTASDSVLSTTDDVTINVNPAGPVNQPPMVNAGTDQTITLPDSANLSGTATDDGLPNPPGTLTTTWSKVSGPGTVTFGDANALNTTASFSAAGVYVLRLTASDTLLSSTDDVMITVNSTGGGALLNGSIAAHTGPIDLSTEGTLDWTHWGLTSASSFNRKSGVTAQISNYTRIGSGAVNRYTGDPFGYGWSDGTPTASVANTTTGIWKSGVNKGFEIRVPADTTDKTLKLYVSVWGAQGRLEVSLSDGSAPTYVDTSLTEPATGNNVHGVYTINFRAASAGQQLVVRWTVAASFNSFGNVTLQAATLSPGTGGTSLLSMWSNRGFVSYLDWLICSDCETNPRFVWYPSKAVSPNFR
jgi:hypothetical protein